MQTAGLRRLLAGVFVLALAIKLIVMAFDHRILFFFGDSQSYLYSAISNYNPKDRSFMYGDVLGWLFSLGLPIYSAIWLNMVASALSSVLVCYCILVLAPGAPRVAFIMGALYAIEPISTTLDGYVLTETLSTFSVLFCLACTLRFLQSSLPPRMDVPLRRSVISLLLAVAAGLVATSFRSANLLLVYFLSVLPLAVLGSRVAYAFIAKRVDILDKKSVGVVAITFLAGLALSFGGLAAYKGEVRSRFTLDDRTVAVGVLPDAGMFTAGIVLPIMQCSDLDNASQVVRDTLCARLASDETVRLRHSRPGHRWASAGAINETLRTAMDNGVPRIVVSNELNQAANHAIMRDPVGFLGLGLSVWRDFWTERYAQQAINNDLGNQVRALEGGAGELLRDSFAYEIEDAETYGETFRTAYFEAALPWMRLLTLTPILAVWLLFQAPMNRKPIVFLFCCFAALSFGPAVFLAERTVFRYFHVIAPLVLIMVGALWVWRPAAFFPSLKTAPTMTGFTRPRPVASASSLPLSINLTERSDMSTASIAVLLPCYNEEHAIAQTVSDFRSALPGADIYVYDNNSTDRTVEVARSAGAIVRREPFQGKGSVVRRMFSDIEADIYVMSDGDATYQASAAPQLVQRLVETQSDMVIGVRRHQTEEAYRPGHKFGNRLLTGLVARVFSANFTDMLSGYRVFSRRFVKSFPTASSGFEIETELTVHAAELGMITQEVETEYYARPEGSVSKLSTFQDGFRILWTILRFCRDERPFAVFGVTSLVCVLLSLIAGLPVIFEYWDTGLVPRLPTAILSATLMLTGIVCLFTGLILDSVRLARLETKRLRFLAIEGISRFS